MLTSRHPQYLLWLDWKLHLACCAYIFFVVIVSEHVKVSKTLKILLALLIFNRDYNSCNVLGFVFFVSNRGWRIESLTNCPKLLGKTIHALRDRSLEIMSFID